MKKILLCLACFFVQLCYAQSGKPDPIFGINGIVSTDMGSAFNYTSNGRQVLSQHDGSMYLVIESADLSTIIKKQPDGSPDLSYGKSGSSVILPIRAQQAAVQADGKIVVAGFVANKYQGDNTSDLAVVRLNINGTVDSSFAANGIMILNLDDVDGAATLVIQPDSKIVVAGWAFNYHEGQRIILARLNTDGSLDDGFGDFGIQQTDFGDNGYAAAVTMQADGKILVAGNTLVRYNTNGTFDSSFNGDGHQLIPGTASALGIQNDGKIIVATNSFYKDTLIVNFVLSRYNINGSIDSSFGENGIQTTAFAGVSQTATTMVIQSGEKIMLGGYVDDGSNVNFGIARYNVDGSLDNSFATNGMLTTDFNSGNDVLNSIALQDDGKLLAVGSTNNGLDSRVAVARYDSMGNPDSFFKGNGAFTELLTQGSTFYTCTAVQSDGKILAAGYTWNGSNYDFALARYNLNGSLDNTFSGDGIQTTDFNLSDDKARAIAIQQDGKIVLCGSAGDDFGLIRLNTNGSLDTSFSTDGMQVTDFGSSDSATAIAIQNDGKIVVAGTILARYNSNGSLDTSFDSDGYVATPSNCDGLALQNDGKIVIIRHSTIARYNMNGSADNSFGNNGERTLFEFYLYDDFVATSINIQTDGKIVIGGNSIATFKEGYESYFTVGRLNTDGSFDENFNSGAAALSYITNVDISTSAIIQKDAKIIQAGSGYEIGRENFLIARHNSDGSSDNTFGTNGTQITHAGGANDRIAGLAVTGNYLYAAGYGQYPGNLGVVARYLVNPEVSAFVTAANGDWNNPNTWIGGIVPNESAEVVVQHKVIITTNTTCYSLKVSAPSGDITVNAGINLTITH